MEYSDYQNYCLIDGVDTRVLGLLAISLPPLKTAKKRSQLIPVNGRSGTIRITADDYENVDKQCVFWCFDAEKLDIARNALADSTTVTFSNEPDYVYDIADDTSADLLYLRNDNFQYPFLVNPLKREIDPVSFTWASGQTIVNTTNEPCFPSFDIGGTGNFEIVIGTQTINVTDVDTSLTIDGELFEVYDDAGSANDRYTLSPASSIGFPVINPGEEVTITFDCDTLIVRPNWRWH